MAFTPLSRAGGSPSLENGIAGHYPGYSRHWRGKLSLTKFSPDVTPVVVPAAFPPGFELRGRNGAHAQKALFVLLLTSLALSGCQGRPLRADQPPRETALSVD